MQDSSGSSVFGRFRGIWERVRMELQLGQTKSVLSVVRSCCLPDEIPKCRHASTSALRDAFAFVFRSRNEIEFKILPE